MAGEIEFEIVGIAADVHARYWSPGSDVSRQTKKSHFVCRTWQHAVIERFGSRFRAEAPLNESEPGQKIDLLDQKDSVAYELKSSPKNVHMEIYRDVFKALVFNERNPKKRIKTLVFIAPKAGILKLGTTFPKDVQAISARLGLELKLREIP